MAWETLGSLLLGFVVAYTAIRRLPSRFPDRRLALATGPAAALLGGFIGYAVLGPGNPAATLVIALIVSGALLSLLVRSHPAQQPAGLLGMPPHEAG